MLNVKRISTLIFAALAVCACERAADEPAEPTAQQANADINKFFERVFEREIAESPITQSQLGRVTDRLGEWDDVSDEAFAARVRRARQDLEWLQSEFDPALLNETDATSYELFVFNVNRLVAQSEFRRHEYVVDQFNGQLSGLITVLQNNHPIKSVTDAENYISRLEGLEKVLAEFTVQLRDRAEFGVIAPAFSFPAVIGDAQAISSGAPLEDTEKDNAVYSDFADKVQALQIGADERQDLLMRASAALRGPFARGFDTLIAELRRLQAGQTQNHGVWSLPDGDAYYANRIRHHTTLDLTAIEIHEIGLADVRRLHEEMHGIMATVGFEGSLREFFDYIRNDPNNYYEDSDAGREAFLTDARRLVDGIYERVGEYFHSVPEAALEVRRVEPWRENSTSIAFYNRPSEDGSRPGIYYANLADMNSVQKYVFSAITYHESAPGHHFQIAAAQEMEGIPGFRKFGFYGAFTEGWALYAERLAREMGFYEDPYHDFGRLQNELWRSVRLVLDTGIHSKRWTRQQSIDYFRENTPLSAGDIVTEVERFFVNPGQALGYKLGMIRILDLRDMARSALGERFDIRDFHEAVIGAGSLPLSMVERRVQQYIDRELESP